MAIQIHGRNLENIHTELSIEYKFTGKFYYHWIFEQKYKQDFTFFNVKSHTVHKTLQVPLSHLSNPHLTCRFSHEFLAFLMNRPIVGIFYNYIKH